MYCHNFLNILCPICTWIISYIIVPLKIKIQIRPIPFYLHLFTSLCVYIHVCVYVCVHTDCDAVRRSEDTVKVTGLRLGGEHLYFRSHLASPRPTHRIWLSLLKFSNLYSLTSQFSLPSNWWKSRLLFLCSLYRVVSLASSLSALPIRWKLTL